MGWTSMNRHDAKCAGISRYKTKAEAEAEATRHKIKHVAYPCECDGFHVVKVGKSQKQERRDEMDAYYGDMLRFCRATIDKEISRYTAAGLRRKKRNRFVGES
jgi:hypothetical protein